MPEAQYTYHFAMQQNTAYIPVDLSYAIGLPPEKAIEYFASKGLKTTLDWQSLWQESHIKAFTIAGAAKLDILQNVKDELDNALHKGIPLQEFKDSLIPRLQALGWLSSSPEKMPYRLENMYRTNIQTAFMAGRYREMMENVKNRPYWQYVAVMDSRTRPAHAALHGKVFRYDDPFWKTFYPPNGFQCRCRVRTYSETDIEERNITVESGKDNIVWEEKPAGGGYTKPTAAYIDPITGQKIITDVGWSYNPGEKFWTPDLRKYDKDIRAAFEKEMMEKIAAAKQRAAITRYVEKTSLPEAEQWAKDTYAEQISYKGYNKVFGSRLSKKGALEKLNKVNSTLDEFTARYPDCRVLKDHKISNVYITSDKRGRATLSRFEDAHVSFANEWDERAWTNTAAWDDYHGRPWDWTKDESHVAYNVRHEIAHIIDGHYGVQNKQEFSDICEKYLIPWRKQNVSDYAGANRHEFFAELFAQYTSPFYNSHRDFPDDIKLFLDKILKGLGEFNA